MVNRAKYIARRLVLTVFSIFVVATFLFFLFRLAPGDPTTAILDPGMTAEDRQLLRRQFGLDEPLHVQYIKYMENLVSLNLGVSFRHQKPVMDLILNSGLNTMALMFPSVLIAFIIGPLIGAALAWHRNTSLDTAGIGLVLLAYATPVFWTGMVAIMIFSFNLGWLPTGGIHSPAYISETLSDRFLSVDFLYHLILPLAVTTLYYLSIPTLIMRNTMIEVIGSDFIEMAQAQGLSRFSILYRHAARNALLPVLHYAAVAIGFAFGGSVVIESVFSWPGVGRLMWQAVLQQNYPLAQGAFLLLATLIIVMNFIVDILSVYVDPRAAVESK